MSQKKPLIAPLINTNSVDLGSSPFKQRLDQRSYKQDPTIEDEVSAALLLQQLSKKFPNHNQEPSNTCISIRESICSTQGNDHDQHIVVINRAQQQSSEMINSQILEYVYKSKVSQPNFKLYQIPNLNPSKGYQEEKNESSFLIPYSSLLSNNHNDKNADCLDFQLSNPNLTQQTQLIEPIPNQIQQQFISPSQPDQFNKIQKEDNLADFYSNNTNESQNKYLPSSFDRSQSNHFFPQTQFEDLATFQIQQIISHQKDNSKILNENNYLPINHVSFKLGIQNEEIGQNDISISVQTQLSAQKQRPIMTKGKSVENLFSPRVGKSSLITAKQFTKDQFMKSNNRSLNKNKSFCTSQDISKNEKQLQQKEVNHPHLMKSPSGKINHRNAQSFYMSPFKQTIKRFTQNVSDLSSTSKRELSVSKPSFEGKTTDQTNQTDDISEFRCSVGSKSNQIKSKLADLTINHLNTKSNDQMSKEFKRNSSYSSFGFSKQQPKVINIKITNFEKNDCSIKPHEQIQKKSINSNPRMNISISSNKKPVQSSLTNQSFIKKQSLTSRTQIQQQVKNYESTAPHMDESIQNENSFQKNKIDKIGSQSSSLKQILKQSSISKLFLSHQNSAHPKHMITQTQQAPLHTTIHLF